MEERSQAEPSIQSSCGQTLISPQEGKLGQEAPESSGLASHSLPELQDPPKGPGSGLSQEKPEPQTPLTNSPQSHPEETPQDQCGQSTQGYKGEPIWGQDKRAPQSQRERKQAQQGQECSNSEVSEEVQGEATVWRQKEGNPQGHSRDLCRSPGKSIPQHELKRIPGPQLTQAVIAQEGVWAPLPAVAPAPEGGILASGGQEGKRGLPGALREQSCPGDPKPSKAAWPVPGSGEETLVSAEQEALQRLLDLYSAARQRRRRDQEQQRLRVRASQQ